MLAKDLVNKAFVTCLHPIRIEVNGVKRLVPCRKCEACENHRKDKLAAQLRAETAANKYCFFLTLTYSDEYLPRFIVNYNYSDYNTPLDKKARIHSDISLEPLSNNQRIWNDVINGYFKLPRVVAETDKSHQMVVDEINEYGIRRAKYNMMHPTRKPYDTSVVDLLYIRDIQNFTKSLRKYISNKFNHEQIRVYTIAEYGTESLRPHYHQLLFFNSDALAKELNCTEVVHTRRTNKGTLIEDTCAICLRPLWRYGYIASCQTDGNAYGYVSNYVTSTSRLPELLRRFGKPKALHSTKLGSTFYKNLVETAIRQKRWDKFDHVIYTDRRGFECDSSIPRSHLTYFFPSLGESVIPTFSCARQILECRNSKVRLELAQIARRLGLKLKEDGTCTIEQESEILYQEFRKTQYHGIRPSSVYLSRAIDVLGHVLIRCSPLRLSPVIRVLYASTHYLNTAKKFGWSLDEMFETYCDYKKYVELKQLKDVYTACESSDTFTHIYYKSVMVDATDKQNEALNEFSDYRDWRYQTYVKNHDNVKHAAVAALYSDL